MHAYIYFCSCRWFSFPLSFPFGTDEMIDWSFWRYSLAYPLWNCFFFHHIFYTLRIEIECIFDSGIEWEFFFKCTNEICITKERSIHMHRKNKLLSSEIGKEWRKKKKMQFMRIDFKNWLNISPSEVHRKFYSSSMALRFRKTSWANDNGLELK